MPQGDTPSAGARMPLAERAAMDATSTMDERSGLLDEVQDVVGAALCGDSPLFDLLRQRLTLRCVGRPWRGATAANEILRLQAIDIVQRHLLACDKRRRLQRELVALADTLRAVVPND
jgi:hypothetical protein